MLRLIYTLLFFLLLPFILLLFLVKSRKEKGYRQRWAERFSLFKVPLQENSIVIHAASVGEVLLIAPLIRQILAQYPSTRLTITTFTPGGSDQVKSLFGEQVQHCYLPFDLPLLMKRFLQQLQPKAFIIVETELWFNLLHQLRIAQIPTLLINARLSAKSAKHYRYFQAALTEVWQGFTAVAAQDELSAMRYRDLGVPAEKVSCTGNLKFDLNLSDEVIATYRQQKQQMFNDRPVWIAGSTHAGEEKLILEVHQQLLATYPSLLLILVPRHSARFAEVEALVRNSELSYQKRSEGGIISADTQVMLGDTMGELLKLYALADIAFVGGSLIERGGHNPLEPLLFKIPVISGQYTFNFKQIYQQLTLIQAVMIVESSVTSLALALSLLLADPEAVKQYGEKGFSFLQQNRGALQQTLALLKPYLSE
ncbi:3-deoxy-D-manno-octulosonic acid transferase [Gallibacterium genomosp. 3]|uniref:3-deoxy-D-manno-octulosonic acid transferase n=2 Tax=Gallibacterium genomosp. 3 TaxID=505345 RepID=A0A1A7Q6R5_9PAST|nr:3-deoxy-D-manno-octulosonic acid transferase [Gallibacterium genomosp. 3]